MALAAVALDRRPLAIEHLRQQDARNGQRLLGQRGELGERLLRLARDPPARAADPPRQVDEDRHHGEREHGQLPGQQHHRDDGAQYDHDVRDERRDRVRDDALHAADVVLQPRLQIAGARVGEETERHRLQVLVEAVPEVLHHVLADDGRQVGLPDADRSGDQRHRDHHADEDVEEVEVPVAARREERAVEDDLRQQRVRDAEPGGDEDRQQDQPDLRPVRLEQPRDARHETLLTLHQSQLR